MSGYTGNPDAEAEQAMIMSENGIDASRSMLKGSVLTHCKECGEEINPARVQAAIEGKRKCHYCLDCQGMFDKAPKIKMLDRIL